MRKSEATQATATSDSIVRKPAVLKRTGLSDTTIWRMVKENRFPAPVRIGKRAVGWRESQFQAWITSRSETR